jgi:diguanylate cyclase (GGDEF)-like protein
MVGLAVAVAALVWRDRAAARKVSSLEEIVQERLSDRALVEELDRSSRTDALTGLFNRRHMLTELPRHLAEADPHFAPLAIALLDLDGFKVFNDANGHLAGDRLLKETATAWLDQLRTDDILVRLGGDEFVAILPKCSTGNALRVAGRLLHALGEDRSCGVGVACWDGGESPEELLARADRAMYASKRAADRAPVLG